MSGRTRSRRGVLGIIAVVAITASALIPAAASAASGATRWVNDDRPLVAAPGQNCNKPGYSTIQAAVTASAPGDTVRVCAGTYFGAVIDRAVHVRGEHGAVINDGPFTHPAFLRTAFLFNPDRTGSGASITGFRNVGAVQPTFVDDGKLDFGVYSRGADDVTVEANQMTDMLQAITDWNGTGWTIRMNDIEDPWVLCGGGIGILVGGFDGVTEVTDNLVSHNSVRGILQVDPSDCGGYDGSGIVLYADFRFGRPGAPAVSDNEVEHNHLDLTSIMPETVDVNDIELTSAVDAGAPPAVITDNRIHHNSAGGAHRNGIWANEGSAGNIFSHNRVHGATEFSCRDDSVGPGTDGTANTWVHNKGDIPSSPPGICDEHGPS